MNRLASTMQSLRAAGKKAVVPYVVAGDPRPDYTVAVMLAMVAAGADVIELGVPFSDPMAEGPVIQLGHERALAHRVGLSTVLAMVREFRQTDTTTPIVLMGYANPIEVHGYPAFAAMASAAGVDAILTVDMPPEEADELDRALQAEGLEVIYLIAPTTTPARRQQICARASGYLYYVSLRGVTGAGHLDPTEVGMRVREIKAVTELPVCVGCGIKDAASAASIAEYADGVVVGSVLVDALGKASNQAAATAAVQKILRDIRRGVDG